MDPTGGKSVPRLHEIVACRVCLATTGKLFWFGSCGLRQAFLDITGTQVMLADGLPQYICYVCCGLLRKAVQFRKKCHNMHTLLLSLTFSDLIKQINLLHYQPLKRSKIVQLSVGEEFENNLNSFKKEELPDVPNEEEIESVLNLNGEEFNSDLGDKELENDFNLNDKELQDVPNYKKIENKEFKTDLGHKKLENILNFKLKDALNGEVFEKHLNLNDKEYKNSLSDKELENDINASNHNDVELGTESHYDDCEENIDDLTPEVDQHQQVAFKNVKLDKKVNSNSCIVKIMHDTDVDKKVTQYILNDPSADEYRKMLYKHIEDKYMKTTGKDESAHDKEKPVYKIAVNTRRRWRCSNFDFKVKKFYKYLKDKYRCLDIPKSNKLQLYRTKQTMELMKKYNFDTVTFSKEEQIKNMLEKKESDRYKNSIYKCEDCYTGFLYEKKYNNHREYHDSALSGSHECDVCRLKFLTNSLLSRHYYHCHKYRYVCKTCGKKFSTKQLKVRTTFKITMKLTLPQV